MQHRSPLGIGVRGRGKRECQSEEGNSYNVSFPHISGLLYFLFYIFLLRVRDEKFCMESMSIYR